MTNWFEWIAHFSWFESKDFLALEFLQYRHRFISHRPKHWINGEKMRLWCSIQPIGQCQRWITIWSLFENKLRNFEINAHPISIYSAVFVFLLNRSRTHTWPHVVRVFVFYLYTCDVNECVSLCVWMCVLCRNHFVF